MDEKELTVDEMLKIVFDALTEKGYDPIPQILGYVFTGDPTYITPHNNARDLISQIDGEDIAFHVFSSYFNG